MGPERQIVLFKLVNALAEQLRGVFVPYYRHLLDLMLVNLGGSRSSNLSSGGKRKRGRAAGPSSVYAGPDAPFLRLQAGLLDSTPMSAFSGNCGLIQEPD